MVGEVFTVVQEIDTLKRLVLLGCVTSLALSKIAAYSNFQLRGVQVIF